MFRSNTGATRPERQEPLEVIRLNLEDSRAFAQALLRPREPSRRLKDAARDYLKTVRG